MITDGKKWDYLAVKRLSTLLKEITSKRVGDFYCLNCFYSFGTENAIKNMKMFTKIMTTVMMIGWVAPWNFRTPPYLIWPHLRAWGGGRKFQEATQPISINLTAVY